MSVRTAWAVARDAVGSFLARLALLGCSGSWCWASRCLPSVGSWRLLRGVVGGGVGRVRCAARAVCAGVWRTLARRAALGTNARVRARRSGPPLTACASACSRAWRGRPSRSARRRARGRPAGASGSAVRTSRSGSRARPASGCARSGPRRRRGVDRRRRLGRRRAARRFSGVP